jgi:uncharacterized membrane protein YkgB
MTDDEVVSSPTRPSSGSRLSGVAALIARYGLVVVIVWFGAMKFTHYESYGVSPLVANSPLLGWVFHIVSIRTFGAILGCAELVTAGLLAVKPWAPRVSIAGGVLATVFFLGTLSFMISTPGIGESTAGGFPVLSATGEFLMKDIALVGLALWLLADSVEASRRHAPSTVRAPEVTTA